MDRVDLELDSYLTDVSSSEEERLFLEDLTDLELDVYLEAPSSELRPLLLVDLLDLTDLEPDT